MQRNPNVCLSLVVLLVFAGTARSQDKPGVPPPAPDISHRLLADYDAELRLPNGRVDVDGTLNRVKQLGVGAYYWLVGHAPTDWDDLKLFLPKAAKAGVQVWVYLLPPRESPPSPYGSSFSEPFRLDYPRWAEQIARLSLAHPNLRGWVIDDFYLDHAFFTPAYVRAFQAKAKAINPRLAFMPLMYPPEVQPKNIEPYRGVVDGIVVAYLQDRTDIDRVWEILNDARPAPRSDEISFPWFTPSQAGDYGMISQTAKVLQAGRDFVRFRERDDYIGPTAGFHYKQLLVDGSVVWEQDVAGGKDGWQEVTVDITRAVRGKSRITLEFRLFDKKPVGNFGVKWRIADLRTDGLQIDADLSQPQKWRSAGQGEFESGFGSAARTADRSFHIPLVSMTAAQKEEFQLRHGAPATPERIAQQLRISLEAWRAGKCDGVVTYCLDLSPKSDTFAPVEKLFHQFGR